MSSALQGDWPYQREQPDVVVLGVQPGVAPSGKPPVRIFLGTEDGQYRAERVFVYSVARHRDPARVYEIHLMKNLAGFNRRGWRTGFTLYRFAIPDLAGGTGKAIYNDVDQIYLADPALLFDLDLGSHGYLAISARDTSVMLIDCARMLPWWNRQAASTGKKGDLTNRPAGTPGLWGELDGHWNARDLEYVEGRTKCLHYTALHQQPWNPFPEQYSYHPNPLAYLWHELERQADAEGFEVFDREAPSPGFLALVGSNLPAAAGPASPPPSPAARDLLREASGDTLLVTLGDAPAPELGRELRRLDLARGWQAWPEGRFAAVLARDLFERLPPADIAWVLGELFARAEGAVLVQLRAQAADGLGSPDWWQRRLAEAAARHPGVSWQLDAALPEAAEVRSVGLRRVEAPPSPRIWVLTGAGEEEDGQARRLASALGWPHEEKRLAHAKGSLLPNLLRGASLAGLDRAASARIEPPWPDLVIAAGNRAVPVARWVRAQSGGRTRLVQLGRPAAPFEIFDLIIATPEQRLPIRGNVLQLAAPLPAELAMAGSTGAGEPLASLPRPLTALLVPRPERPYLLGVEEARALALAARAGGGHVALWLDPALPAEVAAAVRSGLGGDHTVLADPQAPHRLAAGADRVVLSGGSPGLLAEACLAGRPVLLLELPRWSDRLPLLQPVAKVFAMAVGGSTYRGTPLQQHFPGRILDWLVTRGIVHRPRDLESLHRSLEARGLVTRIGSGLQVASPRPLDDLARSVERIRRLLHELPQAG